MGRIGSTLRKDMIVQSRNSIYTMTLVIAVLFAVVFTLLIQPEYLGAIIPAALLLIVGGTTVVFTAILIIDEKELGILSALTVTPLSPKEYLFSKVMSISLLADLEVAIMLGIPLIVAYYKVHFTVPTLLPMLVGIFLINLFYAMLGVVLIVRFNRFTDFMFPAVIVMVVLQIPIIYYADILHAPWLLLIPSAAPVMLVHGAFNTLETWEWVYGIGYSIAIITGFMWWSYLAFIEHIRNKLA